MKIIFILALLLSTFLVRHSTLGAEEGTRGSRPNVVFIFADDWGWGDLTCHGHPWLKTPNIDCLAREGTDFQHFNVLNPVCSPSRTGLMTGHYPARYSIHQHFASPKQNQERNMPDWLDAKAPTLPNFLHQAGYRTAHFGKWHLTNAQTNGAPQPAAYGYDEAVVFNGGAGWPSADLHGTAANTAAFIKANHDKPFFINAWIHESHTPHVPTAEAMEKWKHLDEQKQVYSAVITDGDNAVGTILDALQDTGVADNTIVVFSSDNGPESTALKKSPNQLDSDARVTGYDTYYSIGSNGGLRGRKRSLFEGGVRVPFIVRWPGHTPAGAKDDTTVFTAVDVLPTLCAAVGVTLPADYKCDGENLLPALEGKPISRTRPIFWKWTGTRQEPDWWPRLAVREGDWKLVTTDDANRIELHQLKDDRAESVDLAKEHPDIVARLTKLVLDWNATLPIEPDPTCISTTDRSNLSSKSKPPNAAGTTALAMSAENLAKAFHRMDTNKDGVLTFEEYIKGMKNSPGTASEFEQRFKRFDKDGNGTLTREEFTIR
ncbi:MAG: sulfatase-like hydrolase/transferase [Planctomycetota bacterium]|nr:sulfatase-like hydrolase/transferase [Planctomycetota bacterium]